MKSKFLMVVVVFLIASLVCVGTASCRHDSTSMAGDIEVQNDSDDVIQPLSDDDYRIEIAAIAVELITIVNGLDQVLVNPEIERVLKEEERYSVMELEKKINRRIIIIAKEDFHFEQYEIRVQ